MIVGPTFFSGAQSPYTGTVLLDARFDGSDGDTTFTDLSGFAWPMVGGDTLKLSNSWSKFGGTSLRWYAQNPTSITITDPEWGNEVNEPFTVAFWTKHVTSLNFVTAVHFFRWRYFDGTLFDDLWNYATGAQVQYNNQQFGDEMSPYTYPNGSDVHMELGFDGAAIYLFVDGSLVYSAPHSRPASTNGTFSIGGDASPTTSPDGTEQYMANLFVLKNQCLHTSNFSPPTAPY